MKTVGRTDNVTPDTGSKKTIPQSVWEGTPAEQKLQTAEEAIREGKIPGEYNREYIGPISKGKKQE